MIQDIKNSHRWKFFRYGGLDQVSLENAADLKNLRNLDPKLWAALSCPVSNINFDEKTLEFIDTDKDKRIKIAEVLDAVDWVCIMLKQPGDIFQPQQALPLSAINDDCEEGMKLLSSARQILSNLGRPDESAISLEDLADTEKIFAASAFNGDGIITSEATSNESLNQLIEEILLCMGGEEDRSGKPGISPEILEKFLSAAQAFSEWYKRAESEASVIMVNGNETHESFAAYAKVRAKIEDYFIRSQLATYDGRYIDAGQKLEADYVALLKKDLGESALQLREFPIAMISGERVLKLNEHLNPGWMEDLEDFREKVVKPGFGDYSVLDQSLWKKIKARYSAYESWFAEKKGHEVESLGIARIDAILASRQIDELKALIERDKALEPMFNEMIGVERLVRYYRFLFTFLNNFVNFHDFYNEKTRAIFQFGTLFMDSRSCELCVKVGDVARHSSMAANCFTYLVYCDCVRQGTAEKLTIAAAFTNGDSDNLMIGRNGLFVDCRKNYWDATVTKIIDHPISIRQAFWSPYKKLARLVREQIEKYASSKEKAIGESISSQITAAPTPPPANQAQGNTAFDAGRFAGIFAAVGLALAALGSAVTSIVAGLMSLLWWQIPLAIFGALMIISGPSMIIVGLRLRQRNLGAILDANGWAVNTRAKINVAFGRSLTRLAVLPGGAIRSKDDPFVDKKRYYEIILFIILIIIAVVLFTFPGLGKSIMLRFCPI